jgi:hypothetical protein
MQSGRWKMIYGGDLVLVVATGAKFSASAICSGMILAMFFLSDWQADR